MHVLFKFVFNRQNIPTLFAKLARLERVARFHLRFHLGPASFKAAPSFRLLAQFAVHIHLRPQQTRSAPGFQTHKMKTSQRKSPLAYTSASPQKRF
jgi:hypothetical protein